MNPLARLSLSTDSLRLSDALTVTLTIDALPPYTVTLPIPLLSENSRHAWHIKTSGPAVIRKQVDGQERWSQEFRLEPFTVGELPVEFATIMVNESAIVLPIKTAIVKTAVESGAQPRPLTAPESRPPTSPPNSSMVAPVLVALLLVATVLFALKRRQSKVPVAETHELHRQAIIELEHEPDSVRFCEKLSKVVREIYGLTSQTTSEVVDLDIRHVLSHCDAVRFAEGSLSPETRDALLSEAKRIVSV